MDLKSISLVIITGDGLRHRFFVNRLSEKFNVLGVVLEAKRPMPKGETDSEDRIIKEHFRERAEKEQWYFKGNDIFSILSDRLLMVANRESNSPEVFNWVRTFNPDYAILYGPSIIKDPLLSYFGRRMINMHLGLSPYYRGSGTNFWPLVNREPECVGVTIHLPILKVDAGDILKQGRPQPNVSDRCHDLGCKTIIRGTELMITCIEDFHKGIITPIPQNLEVGRVYRNF